ncbi:MAG: ATP-binding protein [Anaerolineales bacterium]|jgi:ATP-dependent DNA helicase RecG
MTPRAAARENILSLIAQGMGADLHWYPESVSVSDLAGTLAAMGNTEGGRVILGVAPRAGKVKGVKDVEECIDKVFQAAFMVEPILVLPVPAIHRVGGEEVLVVSVPAGLPQVYNLGGRYLGRAGRYNEPFSARQLSKLLASREVEQLEGRVPTDASLEDLDEEQIEVYKRQLNLPGEADWREVLTRRGCLNREGKKWAPTYAASLLFGKNPQKWLPNATIEAIRFPGVSFSEECIKQDITGTLPQQLRLAENFLRDNLRDVVRMIGLTHQITPEYPYEAVRELLVNAAAHRDYNLQGENIQLYIFSDRLEVRSPGELPGPVNLKNLLKTRFSRNAVIAQVLSDMGFVERLGYGLNRVVAVMRKYGLRRPYFEEANGTFRVTLYGEPFPAQQLPDLSRYRDLTLNPRQKLALGYLASNEKISNRIYRDLCPDVHPETLRRDFADLVQRKVLLKKGSKRAIYYILKSAAKRKGK